MVTGDGAYIKKINRGLILKTIIKHEIISRADLAKITGLNKATISVQVANLLEEELIVETQQEHHTIGRRPIMLSINHEAAYVLGIDLDYKQIHYTLADLQGNPVHSLTVNPVIEDYNEIVHLLVKQIKKFQNKCTNSRYGLVKVMIAIHGTVNTDESIYFIPKYQWSNKNLIADLKKKLNLSIHIENNANLSAFAEKVYKYHESNHLITIILTSGIGSGIVIDGIIHRGFHGHAGEMGHMIVSQEGKRCKCGNHGCWELYASEPNLLKQLSTMLNQQNITRQNVQELVEIGDSITVGQLEHFITSISIGLNNIINLYNPETIVINSEILRMLPRAVEKIQSHLHSSVSQYSEIVLSELGNRSCTMGACALAIQHFLEVPELLLKVQDNNL